VQGRPTSSETGEQETQLNRPQRPGMRLGLLCRDGSQGADMKITDYRKVEAKKVDDPAAQGVTIRWLVSQKDGAPNFAMRLFEVAPGGHTPYHDHPFEHEVLILKGKGNLVGEDGAHPIGEGDALFVPGGEKHQFKNALKDTLVFLCMVPIEK